MQIWGWGGGLAAICKKCVRRGGGYNMLNKGVRFQNYNA